MRLLLDTHVLLRAAKGTLLYDARKLVEDTTNELLFSPINMWEIELKRAHLSVDTRVFIQNLLFNGYQELGLTSRHVMALTRLPGLHTDPFDRILIAQALTEQLFLLTADSLISQYQQDTGCIISIND